jgi:hypothetical protein
VITSFSGAHPFRPQCLREKLLAEWPDYYREEYGVTEAALSYRDSAQALADVDDQAVAIIGLIGEGLCPRCGEGDLQYPAGSRVTSCRCIPICAACSDHESIPSAGVLPAISWPWPAPHIQAQFAEWLGEGVPGILDLPSETLVTEDGAARVVGRPHPGGWLESGYDDAADQAERFGRTGGTNS